MNPRPARYGCAGSSFFSLKSIGTLIFLGLSGVDASAAGATAGACSCGHSAQTLTRVLLSRLMAFFRVLVVLAKNLERFEERPSVSSDDAKPQRQ